MARIAQQRVVAFFARADRARTTKGKGDALEDLICYVFEKVPGIAIATRNKLSVTRSEEIDVAFWNDQLRPLGLWFLPHVLLVECKNWTSAVGSSEVNHFRTVLRDHACSEGILVAANGVSGDAQSLSAAHRALADALKDGQKIILITRDDLEQLKDSRDLVELVKKKICEITVMRTCL